MELNNFNNIADNVIAKKKSDNMLEDEIYFFEKFYSLFEMEQPLNESAQSVDEKAWKLAVWSVKFIKEEDLDDILKIIDYKGKDKKQYKVKRVRELLEKIPDKEREKLLNTEEFKKIKNLIIRARGNAKVGLGVGVATTPVTTTAGMFAGIANVVATVKGTTDIGLALASPILAVLGAAVGGAVGVGLGVATGVFAGIYAKKGIYNKKAGLLSSELIKDELKKHLKQEPKKLTESRLPSDPNKDPEFGIPEQKKYPLYDKAHVEAAISLFGHVEPKFEEKLARAIIAKMRKYNIPFEKVGKENRLYKYIPESFRNENIHEEVIKETSIVGSLNSLNTEVELRDEKERLENILDHSDEYPSLVIGSVEEYLAQVKDKLNSISREPVTESVLDAFDYKCEKKSLKEEQKQNTEILNNIRKDIQDELTAVKGYDTHADEAEKEGYKDIADVLRDIRDEEKVHIGELQALLNKYDETFSKSIKDGQKEVMEELTESVLDPVRKERCPDIFDKNNRMHLEVKNFIIDTFMNWKDQLDNCEFTVKGIYLIGSSASYQYTDTSDVDITIVSEDFDESNRDVVRMLPNGNNLPGTNHPVNYYIRAELEERLAENIYDITDKKWIKETEKSEVAVPHSYILELSKFFMNAVDLTLSEFERDKTDYLEYKSLNPEKVEISEEEKADVISKKLFELKSDLDAIRIGNKLIRGFVHEAYDSEDNYFNVSIEIANKNRSPQMSVNNLVYKCLEKYGYREKIDNFIKDAKEFIENEEK